MSKYRIALEGKTYEMEIEPVVETAEQPVIKKEYKGFGNAAKDSNVNVIDPSVQKPTVNNSGAVKAPMPGTILRIEKKEGNDVKGGEVVLVLEAMKMENEILAPADGTITKLYCEAGVTVAGGEVLFEVK